MPGRIPDDGVRRYSTDHLWVLPGDLATIGVTTYIAAQIGLPQVITLPEAGTRIARCAPFAVIGAAKVLCELTAPLTGTVTERNTALDDEPTAIIDHPYETWLVRLGDIEAKGVAELLAEADYRTYLAGGNVTHPLTRRFAPPA